MCGLIVSTLRQLSFEPMLGKSLLLSTFPTMALATLLAFFSGLSVTTATEPNQRETFELDIEPILTARGCNSGPCHGKSGGQNGFALSLFGFDTNFDYDAIVRAGRGRRVSVATPDYSLLLLKVQLEL